MWVPTPAQGPVISTEGSAKRRHSGETRIGPAHSTGQTVNHTHATINQMTRKAPHRNLGFAACALASAFWGTGFFFGKIALREMPSAFMVLYRFLFAMVPLAPLLLRRRPRFSAHEWRLLTLASFLGVPLQFLIQFHGLTLTTVSHASLMVGTMPVILALGATLFAHERLPLLGWSAIAVSTAGAALIALSHGAPAAAGTTGPSLRGDLLIVCSCAIALFWILLNQRLLRAHDTRTVTAWGLALGTLMLLAWVIPTHGLPPVRAVSLAAWAALAASGILCTATTTLLWNWAITQVPASQAGVLLNIEPLMGSLLGITLLHEHLGPAAWIGGTLILAAAITLTSRPQLETHPELATLEAEQLL